MRKLILIPLGATLGAALLLATGCTGEPTTGTPVPATTAPALPTGGAPAVPKRLTTESIQAKPCSPISTDQVTGLGLPQKSATEHMDDPFGPSCTWRFAADNPSLFSGGVVVNDPSHSGISAIYLQNRDHALTKFEPFTAAGYPGAVYDNTSVTDPGHCALSIGLRDDLAYGITVSLYASGTPLGDPCELGKKVAGFVVEYLQKGTN